MKKQTWHSINRQRSKLITKWVKAMRVEYIRFAVPIVERINSNTLDDIDTFIEQLPSENITETLKKLYLDVGIHFANLNYQVNKAYIPEMNTKGLLTDKWVLMMIQFTQDQVFEIFSSITQTPKDEAKRIIKNLVSEAAQSGIGVEKIGKKVANEFKGEWGKAAKWMGRRVAQTETIRASNFASLEGVKNLGIPFQKAWLVAHDGKERETHMIAGNTQTHVAEDMPFVVAGYECQYPSDPSLPVQETVNCRCAVTAFPVDEEVQQTINNESIIGPSTTFNPAQSIEEAENRIKGFSRNNRYGIITTLEKHNQILKALEDTLGKYDTKVNDTVGFLPDGNRSFGMAGRERIRLQKRFVANPDKVIKETTDKFNRSKNKRLDEWKRGLIDERRPEAAKEILRKNISQLEAAQRWIVAEERDSLYSLVTHEAHHTLYYANDLAKVWSSNLTKNKVTFIDRMSLSEYSMKNISELFSEVGCAVNNGTNISENLRQAYIETMKTIQK